MRFLRNTGFNCQLFIEKPAASGNEIENGKRIRGEKCAGLESQLFEWFCQCRVNKTPLLGPILKGRASKISLRLGVIFHCSNGWRQNLCIYVLIMHVTDIQ